METTLRSLRIIWVVLLVATLIYVHLSFIAKIKVNESPNPVFVLVISIVAFSEIPILFLARAQMLKGAIGVLQTSPDDAPALAKWRSANVVSWAISLSVALYGLVLRYTGVPFRQVIPFFVAGLFLMLLLAPRRPS